MKKILLTAIMFAMVAASNGQSRWSMGVMLGGGANISKFSGGSETADALFSNAPHRTGLLGVYARYKICDHMSFQSGYDFSEIGFTYLFAKDYSLKKGECDHFNTIKSRTCVSRMPLMILFTSKPNCRNLRFIAGHGIAVNVIDKNWKSESSGDRGDEILATEETARLVSRSEEVHATHAANASFTWLFGTEKVFKKGGSLSITLQGNLGFTPLAKSTVQYVADGTKYDHTFTNYGSYCSFGLTYFFMPIGSKKAFKSQQAAGVSQ